MSIPPRGYPEPDGFYGSSQPAAGQGWIALNAKRPPVVNAAFARPTVTLNGRPVPGAWGRSVYPVPAGQYQVDAAVYTMIRFGQASYGLNVLPGKTAEVYYSPSTNGMVPGAMGAEPQRTPGLTYAIVVYVVLGIILLTLIGGMIAMFAVLR